MSLLKDFSNGGIDEFKEKKTLDRSKIGKSAKTKGKTGERAIADLLTVETNLKWVRIPNSGSFIGKSNRNRILTLSENQVDAMLGDIFAPIELKYRFIIESKNYKNFAWSKFRDKGEVPANLYKWMKELLYDCESYKSIEKQRKHIGLLYVKINKSGSWLSGNIKYIESIIQSKLVLENNQFYKLNIKEFELLNDSYGEDFFFCEAKSFIKNNKENLFSKI